MFELSRVKTYNSTYISIITYNGKPIAASKSNKYASEMLSYLNGYDTTITDGKVKRELDKYRFKKGGKTNVKELKM